VELNLVDPKVRQHQTPGSNSEAFRMLVQGVLDYAIFLLDTRGTIQTWNEGARRLKGYEASEIIGKHFSIFYPQEAIDRGWPAFELEQAVKEGRFEDQGWRIRKDGSRFWANVVITALWDQDGNPYGFAKVTRDLTERMNAQETLRESERKLRELSLHLLHTQDEERKRIGRDLHDSLGQTLGVLKMQLDMAARCEELETVLGDVRGCAKLVEESIKEVRTISYLLYPPMLEESGLKSAISWYLDGFSERSRITTAVEVSPGFPRLSSEMELAFFRVLQESLTNVHRHSGSSAAQVKLFTQNGRAVLEIHDQGKGLPDTPHEAKLESLGSHGVGLRGMRERMLQVGGSFEVFSSPQGTIVKASVPKQESATSTTLTTTP
jgi:PAS domain S-box-containing protein